MKKFILVVFIGTVLAMNIYAIVNKIIMRDFKPIDHIDETTTAVYTE